MDPLAAIEALKMLPCCGGRERTPVKSCKWPNAAALPGSERRDLPTPAHFP